MSEEVLDLPEFLERVQEDKELLVELLDIFTEDYKQKRQQLEEAVANSDAEQVKSLAHSLKGASGNISAKALRTTFLQLEEAARDGDLSKGPEILAQMDTHYEALAERIANINSEL